MKRARAERRGHVEEEEREAGPTVIPESSIRSMLQFRDLPEDVLTMLSQDTTYMVRHVLHYAAQLMRLSGRSKLTTQDVDHSLNLLNGFQAFGHSEKKPVEYKRIENFFVEEDPEIDILESMNEIEEFETKSLSSLNVQWCFPSKSKVPAAPVASTKGKKKLRGLRKIQDRCKSVEITPFENINDIPDDLLEYYNCITDAVVGSEEECYAFAMNNVRHNAKISKLLPHFLTFADKEVRAFNHELENVQKFFGFIEAMMGNEFMYLGHEVHMDPLIRFVLYCITEPKEYTPDMAPSHWKVRDTACELLKKIIDQWATPVNSLTAHTLKSLEKVFRDEIKQIWSLYGAVAAISKLGADAIEESLIPFISEIKNHINQVVQNSFEVTNAEASIIGSSQIGPNAGCSKWGSSSYVRSEPTTNYFQEQVDGAEKIQAALLDAAEAYMKQRNELEMNSSRIPCRHSDGSHFCMDDLSGINRKPLHEVYKELHDHFGDSLASRLPFTNMAAFRDNQAQFRKKKKFYPTTCADPSKEATVVCSSLPCFLNPITIAECPTKKQDGNEDVDKDMEDVECNDVEIEENCPAKDPEK